MIEGCKHGPTDIVPQPCADCERERLSREGATHRFAERLSELARVGGTEDENAPAAALSNMQAVGDMGTANASKGDLARLIEDAIKIRSAYGYLTMRMAVAKDAQDAYDVAKREFTDHEAAFRRLETDLPTALRACADAPVVVCEGELPPAPDAVGFHVGPSVERCEQCEGPRPTLCKSCADALAPALENGLTFARFSEVNRQRCESPDGFKHRLDSWSTSDWFLATVGELGEAANIAKKLNRYRDGIPGNKESEAALREKLRKELGDVYVYLDLLAQSLGVDIGAAAVEVFNAKSEEIGCPIRMMRADALAPPEPKYATDEQVKASAARMIERHRPSLEKLAAPPRADALEAPRTDTPERS